MGNYKSVNNTIMFQSVAGCRCDTCSQLGLPFRFVRISKRMNRPRTSLSYELIVFFAINESEHLKNRPITKSTIPIRTIEINLIVFRLRPIESKYMPNDSNRMKAKKKKNFIYTSIDVCRRYSISGSCVCPDTNGEKKETAMIVEEVVVCVNRNQ